MRKNIIRREETMPYRDLREFISQLEKSGELHRVKTEVDWNLELSHVAKMNEQAGWRSGAFLPVRYLFDEARRGGGRRCGPLGFEPGMVGCGHEIPA